MLKLRIRNKWWNFLVQGNQCLAAIAWFWRVSSSHFPSIRSIFNDVLQLQNTRAADGKTTLVHYLAQVVEEKHPDLLQFTEELSYVERASRGQIESKAYMYFCKRIIFGGNWFSKNLAWIWISIFLDTPILILICMALSDVLD